MAEFVTKEKTKENRTGIPTQLKERMEQRTELSFDDVRVHYNSGMPSKLGALAYTQGNQVEIGPGQERHLPHELGHVVQQKLGLVRANAMHPLGVAMNTEEALERQADEIGAGRSFGMSPSGNTGMGVVQRYKIIDGCTFAQAPSPEENSKVMVKNGEPASIYFEQSVVDAAARILNPLGIVNTGKGDVYSNPKTKKDIGVFFRYAQGRMPEIRQLPKTVGYLNVKQEVEQPLRPEEKKERAKLLLAEQAGITGELLNQTKEIRNNIISDQLNEISQQALKAISEFIAQYQNKENSVKYIAIYSLGEDIILDIFTLLSIVNRLKETDPFGLAPIEAEHKKLMAAKANLTSDVDQEISFVFRLFDEFQGKVQNWKKSGGKEDLSGEIRFYAEYLKNQFNQPFEKMAEAISLLKKFTTDLPDILIALEIVIEDLEYRQQQIDGEKNEEVVKYIPYMPTGCGASALYREKLSTSLKSGQAKFTNTDFGGPLDEWDEWDESMDEAEESIDKSGPIHWLYHFGTPIHVFNELNMIGPDDRLFIEDAVGKSSDENELANAHWGAYIYGRSEDEDLSWQLNAAEIKYEKLDCRFNELSESLRQAFFKSNNINTNSIFKMEYGENGCLGELEIVARDNMLKYKFSPHPKQYKLYAKHFTMNVAKAIADDFVLQALNTMKENDSKKWLLIIENLKGFPEKAVLEKRKTESSVPFETVVNGVAIENLNPFKDILKKD